MSVFAGKSLSRRAVIGLAAAALATLGLAAPAAAQKAKPIKVAAIYTVPVEQQWVGRIHKALNAAKERGDIEYVYSENVANTDYERVMREYAEAGQRPDRRRGLRRRARARAGRRGLSRHRLPDGLVLRPVAAELRVFDNFIHEPSYLTGMIAGKATKSNIIGMVGGYAIPEVNRLMNAFMDGALSVNPDVKFSVSFINSWYDPPKAKEAAFAMIDAGADILYAERFGVSDAAKERGIHAIGNVIDTAADYPGTILATALWHVEPTIDQAIADGEGRHVRAGRLRPL